MIVTGHPDGTVRMPLPESLPPTGSGDEAADPQLFLFDEEPAAPAHGDPMVVEVKTRGPEAFKRWRTLGAERSHPASVAQAAFYTLGEFGADAGRRDRHNGHGEPHLGLGADTSRPAWSGHCRTPASGSAKLAGSPRPQRAGPRRASG